ncbi:YfbM family protein [Flectobacillus sp. BAB-3569]|uniref:YfbM family protein n=1 Tax=Flectobacillus sp. BAB-3569 TaxID=1509483 RepID=UPI001C3E3FF8|nr:YfbM family protein [Flectobacillus sp. BAB-3569]
MSMIGNLLRVTKIELEEYLKDSSLLEERIYNNTSDEEDPKLVEIDRSWEGILFLLTGQNLETIDHLMARVLFSGQVIDEEQDLGYGPGQYLTHREVKELNTELSKITTEELEQRYDSKRMMELEIYPNTWEEDEMINYLTDYFEILKEVFAEASQNDEAIITFLN